MKRRHISISRFIILVGAILTFSIFPVACENKEEKAKEAELAYAQLIEMFYMPDAELLGIKYSIETEKVLSLILDEHPAFGTTDDGMDAEEFKDRILGKNIAKLIDKFSKRYSIPRQVVASILVDYRAMRCAE